MSATKNTLERAAKIKAYQKEYAKNRAIAWKNAGMCASCGKRKRLSGLSQCGICIKRKMERSNSMKENGVCQKCSLPVEKKGSYYCNKCGSEKYQTEAQKRILRREAGKCYLCHSASLEKSLFCEDHYFKHKARSNLNDSKRFVELKELFYKQNGRCAITGLPMVIGGSVMGDDDYTGDAASVDHKIPKSLGGDNSPENIQWILSWVNNMKSNYTMVDFVSKIGIIHKSLEGKYVGNK